MGNMKSYAGQDRQRDLFPGSVFEERMYSTSPKLWYCPKITHNFQYFFAQANLIQVHFLYCIPFLTLEKQRLVLFLRK